MYQEISPKNSTKQLLQPWKIFCIRDKKVWPSQYEPCITRYAPPSLRQPDKNRANDHLEAIPTNCIHSFTDIRPELQAHNATEQQ